MNKADNAKLTLLFADLFGAVEVLRKEAGIDVEEFKHRVREEIQGGTQEDD